MNKDVIPKGDYCYTPIKWNGYYLEIDVCPYWKITNHGTVKCEYLHIESVRNSEDDYQKALEYFSLEEALFDMSYLLWDQVKECGENYDE